MVAPVGAHACPIPAKEGCLLSLIECRSEIIEEKLRDPLVPNEAASEIVDAG
jgi:hypothetical protein